MVESPDESDPWWIDPIEVAVMVLVLVGGGVLIGNGANFFLALLAVVLGSGIGALLVIRRHRGGEHKRK
jgi:hypothetical protein